MRILILGAVGAGKTTLAKKLSRRLGIKSISSDDIFSDKKWKTQNNFEVCKKLRFFDKNENWIIEGTRALEIVKRLKLDIDYFVVLNYSGMIVLRRIFARFWDGRMRGSAYGRLGSLIRCGFWAILYSPLKDLELVRNKKKIFILKKEGDERGVLKFLESKAL